MICQKIRKLGIADYIIISIYLFKS
jgi:hypothetical protein